MVFSRQWFKEKETILLYYANTSKWFREKCGIKSNLPLVEISNSYFVEFLDEETRRLTTYTRPVIARELRKNMYALWTMFHIFDKVVNRFNPKWNLGFDTLDAYPLSGGGEQDSCDGDILSENASWTTCRNATTGTARASFLYFVTSAGVDRNGFNIQRSFMSCVTSAIGGSSTIDSAAWKWNHTGYQGDPLTIHIVESTQADPGDLVGADFDNVGTTSFGSYVLTGFVSGYITITLNSSGESFIDKDGTSMFAGRADDDLDNNEPDAINNWTVKSADYTGESVDPYLTVEYTLGSAAGQKMQMMI